MTRRSLLVTISCLVAAILVTSALGGPPESRQTRDKQEQVTPFPVACSVEKPVVQEGGSVAVRAWVISARDQTPEYVWTTTTGKISGAGQEGHWGFAGVSPASRPYEATVRITLPTGVAASCSVKVIVENNAQQRARGKETGRSFLIKDKNEVKGYGLYSYLLLGAPPTASNRERYVRTIETFLSTIVEIIALEDYIKRSQLNVTYLPVVDVPTPKPSADWILEHYDYARARSLLNLLPGNSREGPYFISVLKPLEWDAGAPSQYLFQDMSAVPANTDLISWWVREFLNQAAQERFWEARTAGSLVLKLRTTIAALAIGLPDVKKGFDNWKELDTWISWIH